MTESTIALTIRIPAKLKHRATVAAAREGVSINMFIQKLLDDACPQENPLADQAHQLAKLALSYDADAPRATRAELAASLRALSARLAETIDNAPEHENW